MPVQDQELRDQIYEDAEDFIIEFINRRCKTDPKYFVIVSDFKAQLKTMDIDFWVSQKVLSQIMADMQYIKRLIYVRGKQQQVWFGLKIGIRSQ